MVRGIPHQVDIVDNSAEGCDHAVRSVVQQRRAGHEGLCRVRVRPTKVTAPGRSWPAGFAPRQSLATSVGTGGMPRIDPHGPYQSRWTHKGAHPDAAASERSKMIRTDWVPRRRGEH